MVQNSFFQNQKSSSYADKPEIAHPPLAESLRPKTLKDYAGQKDLIGPKGPIYQMIQKDDLVSMVLWGPPGCGKTTLARIIANDTSSDFHMLSAVNAGKKEVSDIINQARTIKRAFPDRKTILFLDEIHRFNKAQQDFLLPYVEDGTIILIGATTENPSFEINSALLSRVRVFTLSKLNQNDLKAISKKAIKYISQESKVKISFKDKTLSKLITMANGDSRNLLNMLELISKYASSSKTPNFEIDEPKLKMIIQQAFLYSDKSGEEHYDLISALHKSMRSSDPNASLYWLARMLESGQQPEYIARRMLRFAAEDVGNADAMAVILAEAVFEAVRKIGLPECKVHLAQLAIYLALAPKDNSAYIAYAKAAHDAKEFMNLPVPMHLRNAPTKLMKDLGYSKGYIYDHDVKGKRSGQQCMPDKLKNRKYL